MGALRGIMLGRSEAPEAAARAPQRAIQVAAVTSIVSIALVEVARLLAELSIPGSMNLLAIAVASVLGGLRAGLITAAITLAHAFLFYSVPGQLFAYEGTGLSRIAILLVMSPAVAVLVGGLRDRADRQAAASTDERISEIRRMVTQTTPDAIVTIDRTSTITFANPAVETIFGWAPEALIGQPLTLLMPETLRGRHTSALRRYLAEGGRTIRWDGAELVGRRADGEEIPIEVSFAEFTADGERIFTGSIRDIRERKHLEAQLVQSQKLEAIGQLAGGVAHDFNNVLTAVGGYAELLSLELPPGDQQAMAQGIRQSTSHAAGLVRQLLAFSRRQILRPTDLDLNAVINGLLPLLRGLIREDIELRWAPTDGLWSVKADPTQVEQVIVNLAINARDAMPRGGMMTFETANVELDAAHARSIPELGPGRYVLLAVSDTGVGMDAAILERAFEPFFTTKDVGEGTGLGLATAYGIVRQSGGHIWADSEPGRGTGFKIFLPRADPSAVEAPAPEVRPIPKGRGGRILVVEDEEGLRALVATILRRHGYEAVVAADGPAALSAAKAAPIDLLLTDVVLPGMGGLEISAEVRKIRPEARVLFMSGYTADAIDQRSLLERDAVLLEKPFSADDLVAAIEKALGRLEAR